MDGKTLFKARMEAAKQNDRLARRDTAAEFMHITEAALEKYELNRVNRVPADKILIMAEAYNAPELKNIYCKTSCPIGCREAICTRNSNVQAAAIRILHSLEPASLKGHITRLIGIAADGEITAEEGGAVENVSEAFNKIVLAISEFNIIAEREGFRAWN